MSDSLANEVAPAGTPANAKASDDDGQPAWPVQYLLAVVFVALAAVLAFVVEHLVAAPNLTLIFVLPVVIAATLYGWGPSLAAVAASVLAFDFFFTEPRLSFTIASPSDIWAAALLSITASIVCAVAARSRSQAIQARKAAEQTQALQAVAHVVIEARSQAEVVEAAATALHLIFCAPAAIFEDIQGSAQLLAVAGAAIITDVEQDAAHAAAASGVPMRAEAYPFDRLQFDLWPVAKSPAGAYVLAVDFTKLDGGRPDAPERLVEVVGGYLAAAAGGRARNLAHVAN